MSNFSFNFTAADQVLDDVARINQSINQALDELERNVERQLDAWESEQVKTVYQDVKLRWENSAAQMNAFLNSARQTLGSVAENYGATEMSNAALWG